MSIQVSQRWRRALGNGLLLLISLLVPLLAAEWLFRTIFHIPWDLMPFHYRITQEGFRGEEPGFAKDLPNQERILMVGDSYLFGFGVEESVILPRLLENTLNRSSRRPISVIAFGRPGWNTTAEKDFLLQRGDRYASDQVVVVITFNDIELQALDFTAPHLFLAMTQMVTWHAALFQSYLLKQYLRHEHRNYEEVLISQYLDKNSQEWRAMRASFLAIRDWAKQRHKPLLLFLFEFECDRPGLLRQVARQELAGLATEESMDFLAPTPVASCDQVPGYRLHHFDAHPSRLAHAEAAQLLANHLGGSNH